MPAKRTFKSDLSEAIYSSASALYRVGALTEAAMTSFAQSCLKAPTARLMTTSPQGWEESA